VSAGSNESELMVSRDLGKLAPLFAARVRAAIEECNAPENDLRAMVYEAYRSQALQAMYYKRGRTVIPPQRPVTNAPTNMQSWHGYGLAVDVVHREKFWSPPGGEQWFRDVAKIFKKHDCSWGGDWTHADPPHFQWGRCTASPSEEARRLCESQGMQAVWAKLAAVDEDGTNDAAATPAAAVAAAAGAAPAAAAAPASAAPTTAGRQLGVIDGEGFECVIVEDPDGRVHFRADADIDADGANGQNGAKAAYRSDDTGSELLANGGMGIVAGKVVCLHAWARDVVILGADNQPKVFSDGVIASKTWYRDRSKPMDDRSAYIDAETVPYIVVPALIVQRTAGVVRGCKARVTWQGRSVDCVVADRGPATKIGELSIAAARAIGMPSSPRNGGVTGAEVSYELWPGVPALGFELQPA